MISGFDNQSEIIKIENFFLFVKLNQLLQMLKTGFCSFFGLFEESLSTLWERLDQTGVTSLVVQEILIRAIALFGNQSKWILTLCLQCRI